MKNDFLIIDEEFRKQWPESELYVEAINAAVLDLQVAFLARGGDVIQLQAVFKPIFIYMLPSSLELMKAAELSKSAQKGVHFFKDNGLAGTSARRTDMIKVTINPKTSSVGQTTQFSASVSGDTTNAGVTYKASKGTINSAGLYTAPAGASTGQGTVTATSVADPTASDTASVA
jgi:hypothetical protein